MKNPLVSLFVLCLAIILFTGCGTGLSPAEKAEADKGIAEHGTKAVAQYLFHNREASNPKILKYLISQGADVNALDSLMGFTPLSMARGNIELVKILISKGADVNAKSKNGLSFLDSAIDDGDIELVKFLFLKKSWI